MRARFLGRKVQDYRSLWGGFAFLITGSVLTVLLAMFLYFGPLAGGVFKSRMLWEIVLNLQVLSIALIWFAFDRRFENSTGIWRARVIVNFIFAAFMNCVPAGFFLFLSYYAWQGSFPSEETIVFIIHIFLVIFFSFEFLTQIGFRFVTGRVLPRGYEMGSRPIFSRLVALWPGWVAVLFLLAALLTENSWYYVVMPMLGYLQSAKDFLVRAYRQSSVASAY